MTDTTHLHSGDIITLKQGSMELYVVMPTRLKYIGNVQNGPNAVRYAGARRLRWPCAVTIDGVPAIIEASKVTGRPRVIACAPHGVRPATPSHVR